MDCGGKRSDSGARPRFGSAANGAQTLERLILQSRRRRSALPDALHKAKFNYPLSTLLKLSTSSKSKTICAQPCPYLHCTDTLMSESIEKPDTATIGSVLRSWR